MGLFDEIRQHLEEAMREAEGRPAAAAPSEPVPQPAPRPAPRPAAVAAARTLHDDAPPRPQRRWTGIADLRRAVVMAEILAPPKALRQSSLLGRRFLTGTSHAPNLRQS